MMRSTHRVIAALHGLATAACIALVASTLAAPSAMAAVVTISVSKSGTGGGTVTTYGNAINCGTKCSAQYPTGATVTLSASTDGFPNSRFTGWLGACTGLNSCTISVNGATHVSATFGLNIQALRLDIDQSGNKVDALTDGLLILRYLLGVRGEPLIAGAVAPGATRRTAAAITEYLDALRPALDVDANGQADASTDGLMLLRYLFGLRDAAVVSNATGAGARRNAAAIQAQIAALTPLPEQVQFIPYVKGLGTGTLTGNPGIACGLDCIELFPRPALGAETPITVTAMAAPQSMLLLFPGDCDQVNSNQCTTRVGSDRMVPVRFDPQTWIVSVQKQGNGSVTSTPPLVSCGSQCIASFPRELGTIILTASPVISAQFTGWSGACFGTQLTCQLPLFGDVQVGATFMTTPVIGAAPPADDAAPPGDDAAPPAEGAAPPSADTAPLTGAAAKQPALLR
jgi:hypothetical protein